MLDFDDAPEVSRVGFSAAAARISGAMDAANLVGSFSIMSFKKEGR